MVESGLGVPLAGSGLEPLRTLPANLRRKKRERVVWIEGGRKISPS
jgi:hypothetical protein